MMDDSGTLEHVVKDDNLARSIETIIRVAVGVAIGQLALVK